MIKTIFEKVNLTAPIEQRRFFNYFNDSVNELCTMFGERFVFGKDEAGKTKEYAPITALEDECAVLPLYSGAIVDNILFLSGAGETYKSEFMRKAENAYLEYWRENAKGRIMKRARM